MRTVAYVLAYLHKNTDRMEKGDKYQFPKTFCNMRQDVYNNISVINPRRACAARVTVVVLSVCLFVSATRAGKIMWRFC